MIAVILAAGKGTRMGDLGKEIPKAMLQVAGKSILEHKLDLMPESIDEVILVVGHLREQIIRKIKERYGRLKITYVILERLIGTADALFACKEHLKDEPLFLVMMGDDIYSKEDMESCLCSPWAILISKARSLFGKAKVEMSEDKKIKSITEKYNKDEPGFVCAGMYALTPEIFNYPMVQIPGGEYGLPQTILSGAADHEIHAIESTSWIQITKPEDLKIAENHINIKSRK